MLLAEFKRSVAADSAPPEGLSVELGALWYDAKGDWEKAHEGIHRLESREACWVHAYLHRKEGDLGNASYWYGRAGQPVPKTDLAHEWEQITRTFLAQLSR
ncbi:hypothetical protein AXK11_02845 [Cephaloticoccus primus]|uniref:Uncharacterized protein n=1 Tax=Cephaloticoccus primus TaxID=1548207 RepID=A0A139SRA4_9BACT|nr:hypothetical protein [Cephaloticoccus primus]KXU37129.1 hypothetical protein AXK11_02845 [Cephaloticoccus primus]